MKKIIALFFSISILICLYVPVVSADADHSIGEPQCKMSQEFANAMLSLDDNGTIIAYVFVTDVDHTSVMTTFSEEYGKEYKAYISSKESQDFSSKEIIYDADMSIKDAINHEESIDSKEYVTLLQNAIEVKRELYRKAYCNNNKSIISKYCDVNKEVAFVSEYAPMAIVEINSGTIEKMLFDDNIIWMDVFVDEKGEDTLKDALNKSTL